MTPEARTAIEQADEVFFLVDDPVMQHWIAGLNACARSLQPFYAAGRQRTETYEAMTEAILDPARRGAWVCAAFYGHPGVFVRPSHEAIRRARLEGFEARMLPAVSAEDCLFSDIGFDPGETGCQSYEATEFLMHARTIDTSAALVLWQVGFLGQLTYAPRPERSRVPVLVDYLLARYPPDHEVVVYEALPYPVRRSSIERVALSDLATADLAPMATLYVPPLQPPTSDPAMLAKLGLGTDA